MVCALPPEELQANDKVRMEENIELKKKKINMEEYIWKKIAFVGQRSAKT